MDQMLPSPGFSIPSIGKKCFLNKKYTKLDTTLERMTLFALSPGTPLHQPEEDQQIHPNALQQQQQVPPLAPMGSLTPTLGLGMGMSMMPQTKHSYVSGFSTPQSMMQSQTPVSYLLFCSFQLVVSCFFHFMV